MDYLTQYYKNLSESLQERLNQLEQIKAISDARRQMNLDEAYRMTPQRLRVLNQADYDAQQALGKAVGSKDPDLYQASEKALSKSGRAEILRQLTKPEEKRTGAWAGSSDEQLKLHLKWSAQDRAADKAKYLLNKAMERMDSGDYDEDTLQHITDAQKLIDLHKKSGRGGLSELLDLHDIARDMYDSNIQKHSER